MSFASSHPVSDELHFECQHQLSALPLVQDAMWAAVEAQLQQAGSSGGNLHQASATAAQVARLLAIPGLRCADSLAVALGHVGQQARICLSLPMNPLSIIEAAVCRCTI